VAKLHRACVDASCVVFCGSVRALCWKQVSSYGSSDSNLLQNSGAAVMLLKIKFLQRYIAGTKTTKES